MSASFTVSFSDKPCIVVEGKYIPNKNIADMFDCNQANINNIVPKDMIHHVRYEGLPYTSYLSFDSLEFFLNRHWDNAERAKAAVDEIRKKTSEEDDTPPAWWNEFIKLLDKSRSDTAVFDAMKTAEFARAIDLRVERHANEVHLDEAALEKEYMSQIESDLRREISAHVRAKIAEEQERIISGPLTVEDI